MRIRDLITVTAVSGLATTGALFPVDSAAAAPHAAQAAAPPIVARSGTLTARPSGLPSAGTPAARQLRSAKAATRPHDNRATATVVLREAPGSSHQARLRMSFGVLEGGSCNARVEYSTPTHGTPGPGWRRSGTTYTLDSIAQSVYSSYDCAFAALTELNGYTTTFDVLGGNLAPTYASPKLKIQKATLLGSKKLKLPRGEWVTLTVDVRNIGTYQTGNVVVRGKGKGVKVKSGKTSYALYPESTASVPIKVKLTSRRMAKLKLTAIGPATKKATKVVKVKPAKAPKRIRDGKYRSKDKRVNFAVRKGRITGFRIYALTTCGGYPDFPTYTWNHYSIPKRKIPKSGILQIVEKGRSPAYTASLNGRAAGTKVKAQFSYSGPNRCRASAGFTAQRIGR